MHYNDGNTKDWEGCNSCSSIWNYWAIQVKGDLKVMIYFVNRSFSSKITFILDVKKTDETSNLFNFCSLHNVICVPYTM